ncbi:MAG TPA: hypothetical protein V6C93_33050 [Allocoleopsis sp.]
MSSHLSQAASVPPPKASTSQTATSDGATTLVKWDTRSIKLPSTPITQKEVTTTQTPYVASGVGELSQLLDLAQNCGS